MKKIFTKNWVKATAEDLNRKDDNNENDKQNL